MSGSIVTEDFDLSSVVEHLVTIMNESGEEIYIRGIHLMLGSTISDTIRLETGGEMMYLVLDGTNLSLVQMTK